MQRILSKLTFWNVVTGIILLLGAYSIGVRLFGGLGAATNLSDKFPWGLWIGFDVLCGVGLAAGGFTLCAIVYIFNLERYKPVVRPAILTAFLGYALVAVAISLDIGRPWRIWHPIIFWNPNSVMFEVAWCVTLYLSVLGLEFSPALFERLRSERALKIIHAIQLPLVIAGIVLSMLHQSSLGSLYLIMPQKLHPLWYSSLLPVLFFVSAVAIGMAMVIIESTWSKRAFGKELEMPILMKLGQGMVVMMGVYGVMRLYDMYYTGRLAAVTEMSSESIFFIAEMVAMVIIPLILVVPRKLRQRPQILFMAAFISMLGFILNRLNVAVTGMLRSSGSDYMPHWMEWATTAAIVAGGMVAFRLAVKYLNVFPEGPLVELEKEQAAATAKEPSAVPAPATVES